MKMALLLKARDTNWDKLPKSQAQSNDVVIKKLIADLEQLLQNLKTAEQWFCK